MINARQLVLDLPIRTAQGRAEFFVSMSNEEAVAWLDRWPHFPGHNLFLYGPAGCGKSHLIEVWRVKSKALVIKPSQLIQSNIEKFADYDAVALDGIDHKLEPEPLLHLYNLLQERGAFLLLASRVPPGQLQISLPDLRSRLLAIPVVRIFPPDDGLLVAVMAKLFADRQVLVGQDVLSFLAARIERSFAAVEQIVNHIDEISLSGKRPITVHSASAAISWIEEEQNMKS